MNVRIACAIGLLFGVVSMNGAAQAADDADFTAAKLAVAKLLKNKDPLQRIAGLNRLAEFPVAESAELILKNGFKDNDEGVRRAAYESLLTLKNEPKVCEFLLSQIHREAKRKSTAEMAPPLVAVLAVLLSSTEPQAEREIPKMIDEDLATSNNGQRTLNALIQEFGRRADPVDVPGLMKLANSQAYQRDFSLRRATVFAMCKIRHADAVDALIRLMTTTDGEARADIALHLTAVTKEAHGLDPAAWSKWWQANKATFHFPPQVTPLPERVLAVDDMGTYYGLTIYASRLVFVIDTSGSMDGERMQAAKRELIKAIGGLRDDAQFAVVAFNDKVTPWQTQLVPANSQNKQAGTLFVQRLEAKKTTAAYDALQAAFSFDAEAIYFLTDGVPYGGKVDAPAAIVDLITKGNGPRRESIYAIGIGVGPSGGPFEQFLKTLADRNYGVFRRVDE